MSLTLRRSAISIGIDNFGMVSPISITHEWAEEKNETTMSCLLCLVPTKFPGFRNFRILLLHQPLWDMTSLSYEWYLPLTMFCVDDDNVALSSLLAVIVHVFIHSNQMLYVALNQQSFFFLWSSPIASNEVMQSVAVKAILFLTSKTPVCVSQAV